MNFKKTISSLFVLVVAVISGLAVGKVYVDSLPVKNQVNSNESLIREDPAYVQDLMKKSVGKTPDQFSGLDAFLIAEQNFNNSSRAFRNTTGSVVAKAPFVGDVTQYQKTQHMKVDGVYLLNKLSPSTSSMAPTFHAQMIYNINTPNIVSFNEDATFTETYPAENINAIFNTSKAQTWTLEKYQENFGTAPTTALPFIISSHTWSEGKNTKVNKAGENFTFTISLTAAELDFAGFYYKNEIQYFAGSANQFSKWVSAELTVVVDKNFNFVSFDAVEKYYMFAMKVSALTVNEYHDDFFFGDEVPSINEIAGWEVI